MIKLASVERWQCKDPKSAGWLAVLSHVRHVSGSPPSAKPLAGSPALPLNIYDSVMSRHGQGTMAWNDTAPVMAAPPIGPAGLAFLSWMISMCRQQHEDGTTLYHPSNHPWSSKSSDEVFNALRARLRSVGVPCRAKAVNHLVLRQSTHLAS